MPTRPGRKTWASWAVIDMTLLVVLYLVTMLSLLEKNITFEKQQERPSQIYRNVTINGKRGIEEAQFCQNHFEAVKYSWIGKTAVNRTCQNYWYFPDNNSITWNKDVWCTLTRVDISYAPRVQLVWHKVVKKSAMECVTLEFNFTAEGQPKDVLQHVLNLKKENGSIYQLKSEVQVPLLSWVCLVLFSAVLAHLLIRIMAGTQPIRGHRAETRGVQPPASAYVMRDAETDAA